MNEKQRYCTRPSRLFSGDPSALFAVDANYFSQGSILEANLSSPFQFQLDTQQVPSTQFWHIPKLSLSFFSPNSNINNVTDNAIRLFLCDQGMVGKQATSAGGGVQFLEPNNLGVEIQKVNSDLINDTAGNGGWQAFFFEVPISIPPLWFLRLVIIDGDNGPTFLPAGTQITLRMMREIIPAKFALEL